jgi:hypothetical protein
MSARLTAADTAWLHMDRPTNLMVINAVELFDKPPAWERVRQIVQSRLVDRYPRFRQRVVESASRCAPPDGKTIPTSPSSTTCTILRFLPRVTAPRSKNLSET